MGDRQLQAQTHESGNFTTNLFGMMGVTQQYRNLRKLWRCRERLVQQHT
ncbi:hypothetical protein [Aerosakkonema funiforme]|uniref:Uncharacterized protein n=1 Tax=Aerosakkonema funiforme FACHB-1375 TaxID=2949571 RepID=A0A926ZJN3_9CYAN|nr:hypothetical protein [Aerosakkonema funiforme]MBD2185195.1 hypothetical protein [Aerosakkonema funiforme FACHB-1375]